ncbi:MAG: DUF896 domain-containing protein [Clostridiaceae bacterium]
MNNIKEELELIELDELIEGINRFTAISRLRELTTDETNRRQLYRQEYIQRMRRNLTATLDNTDIEFADEDKNGSNC